MLETSGYNISYPAGTVGKPREVRQERRSFWTALWGNRKRQVRESRESIKALFVSY